MKWEDKYKGEYYADGSYGEIYELQNDGNTTISCVLKVLRFDSFDPEDRKRIIREINCLFHLKSNSNVIDILDCSTDASYPWFVMPKADSNLFDYISSAGVFDEEQCLNVIFQILNAIEEAHDKDIIHRDLGASNILLFTSNNLLGVKVADFSLGRDFNSSSKSLTRMSTSRLGQEAFVAPEQIRNLSLATKLSDIYAIGSLMSFMLTGEDPRIVEPTHSNLHYFITKCREKNPSERPQSIEELRNLLSIFQSTIQNAKIKTLQELIDSFMQNKMLSQDEFTQLKMRLTQKKRDYDRGDDTYSKNIAPIIQLKELGLLKYWIENTESATLINFTNEFIIQSIRISGQVRWTFRNMTFIADILFLIFENTKDVNIKTKIFETLISFTSGFSEVRSSIQKILKYDYSNEMNLLNNIRYVALQNIDRLKDIFVDIENDVKHYALIEIFE